ncbi:Uncharacterised protein [Halioglobus japonicus]|nr:Uncharacterised protein [Halioglobus japonicus]
MKQLGGGIHRRNRRSLVFAVFLLGYGFIQTAGAALIASGGSNGIKPFIDNSASNTGFLTTFMVSSEMWVNRMDQLTYNAAAQNMKFVIFNANTLELLLSTSEQVFGADTGDAIFENATYKQSPDISFTFNVGTICAAGVLSESYGNLSIFSR